MRRLTLNRELLAELTSDELATVAAGAPDLPTFPLQSCVFQCGLSMAPSCIETNCCS